MCARSAVRQHGPKLCGTATCLSDSPVSFERFIYLLVRFSSRFRAACYLYLSDAPVSFGRLATYLSDSLVPFERFATFLSDSLVPFERFATFLSDSLVPFERFATCLAHSHGLSSGLLAACQLL